MKISDIKFLRKTDFSVYKQMLLDNQKHLLDKLKKEHIFISAMDTDTLEKKIDSIKELSSEEYPLLGVPFAVKDNIDVKGFDTTAGCKEYCYTPRESAFSVRMLEEAGAICIGKTNLDQFATGLVGTRSPYGVAKNYYNEEYIPGGSSSGSASAITAGYVPFALGTDTAGSGRVPAAFQNLIGVKPTRGIVSCTGVVPACKSLDCVAVFFKDIQDSRIVMDILGKYDEEDVYSRKNVQKCVTGKVKIAIPLFSNLKFFGNGEYENAFKNQIKKMKQYGYDVEEIDFSPMFDVAKLLYDGPWVAERYHAVGSFIEKNPDAAFPATMQIILGGKNPAALDYFDAEYKLRKFRKIFDEYACEFSAFIMPTAGTIYKVKDIEKEPIRLNSNLGYYTNFMNLLDCSALALPVAITKENLPFGITVFAPAFNDRNLLDFAGELFSKGLLNRPVETEYIDLAVCGAHKRNCSLNDQLTDIDVVYKETAFTSEDYRFFAFENMTPVRPGLVKDPGNGGKIEVEIWKVPASKLGGFINNIPEPLGFGKITLEDGRKVTSFLCEDYAVANAKEITSLHSWENYIESRK